MSEKITKKVVADIVVYITDDVNNIADAVVYFIDDVSNNFLRKDFIEMPFTRKAKRVFQFI